MLREGDLSQIRSHERDGSLLGGSNRWSTPRYLKVAWQQLRCNGTAGKVDVQGTNRGLEALATLASTWSALQKGKVADFISGFQEDDVIFVRWHHDATPSLLQFGQMEEVLAPHARYIIAEPQDNGEVKWRAVPLHVFRQYCPTGTLRSGVLEVLGQQVFIATTRPSLEGVEAHRTVIVPPMILQAGNSNCVSNAGGQATCLLDLETLPEVCSRVKYVFLSEFPDEVAANRRQMAYWQQQLEPVPNILISTGACVMHKLHRITVKATKEDDLCGHCHAVQVVLYDRSKRAAIRAAWLHLVEENLVILPQEPDPHCISMQASLLSHTVLRDQDHCRGCNEIM